jgi:hypothetical protein
VGGKCEIERGGEEYVAVVVTAALGCFPQRCRCAGCRKNG